jgi:glutaredoxin
MTQAVCFKCGEIKFGAFVPCPYCNARPSADEELILSLAMTDHYFDLATMKKMGTAVKDGKSPHLDEKSHQDLLKQVEKLKKMPMGRLITGKDSIPAKRKRKWWPF